MSPSTSRRTVLRQVITAAIGLPAAGLLAACGAGAPSAATTASVTAATPAAAAVTTSQTAAATSVAASTKAAAVAKATTSAAPKANVAKGTVWLTYWGSTADDKLMRAKTDLFTKTTNTPVTAQNVAGDYVGTLTAYFAAGTPPDVATFVPENVPDLIQKGIFIDMQPLIARDKADLSDFVPAAVNAYRYKGGLYGLPENFHSEAIWYNVDRFHEVDVKPPDGTWTVGDYLQAAQKLTDNSRSMFGATMPIAQFTLPWIWMFGGHIVDNHDNPTRTTFSDAKTVAALQWIADLRNRYHVVPTAQEAASAKGDTNMFYQGSVAMFPYLYVEGRVAAFAKGFTWDVGPLPLGADGKPVTFIATGGLYMPKGSINPDLAWKFVQFATSVEAMKLDAKTGIGIPARLSVTTWPEFRAGPPTHKDVFIEQAKYGRMDPIFPGWGPVLGAAWTALAPLFSGNSTAVDAAAKADQAANAEWQKYKGT